MTLGSLFSGIGGIDLGFQRAGFEIAWQVEIDEFCRKVLAKHWPDTRRHDDVKTFPPTDPSEWKVDVIAGGFPCQDISNAGRREGIGGKRSGLWSEFARIVREIGPKIVVIENVPAIFDRGIDRVLCDLAAIGFDAEWGILPASSVGSPVKRERFFGVCCRTGTEKVPVFSESASERSGQLRRFRREKESDTEWDLYWATGESRIQRVVDGVPNRVDRLKGLGNAVVPQVAEWIARRIAEL